MSAPFIWIVLPLLVSIILLLIRKNYALANLIQLAFCILMIFFLFITRIAEKGSAAELAIIVQPTMNILGRSFILADTEKFTIGLYYVALAAWSLVLFIKNKNSKIVPLGLTLSGLLLAAMAVEPFLYSALIIEVAVIISILIAFDADSGRNKGIIRALIFFTLGMPFISCWQVGIWQGGDQPGEQSTIKRIQPLVGIRFIFWRESFPFHSWVPLIRKNRKLPIAYISCLCFPFRSLLSF